MINEIIENPIKLSMVRDINAKQLQPLIKILLQNHTSLSYGINVMEDKKSLITSMRTLKKNYYAIVRDDNYHRITIEYGLKTEVSGYWKTRKPKNFDEYMICNELAITLIKVMYDIQSLGELKRND